MKYKADDIFTPQGLLAEVEKNPNLDFLMNIFNIPRAFSVSGFGDEWSVGKHAYATALIGLFWAKFNRFKEAKKNKLVVFALLHDSHEAVTGDILPMFKTPEVRDALEKIQNNILKSLDVAKDSALEVDMKIIDLISFLYEAKQVKPNILNSKQLSLANTIASRQREILFMYCKENKVPKKKVQRFLDELGL